MGVPRSTLASLLAALCALTLCVLAFVACTPAAPRPPARPSETRAPSSVSTASAASTVVSRAPDLVAAAPPCVAERGDLDRATLIVDVAACRVVAVPSVEAGGLRYAATIARDDASYWTPAGDGVDRRGLDGRVVEHVTREPSIAGNLVLVDESADGRLRLMRRISGETVLMRDGVLDRVLPPWTAATFAADNRRVAFDVPEQAPILRRIFVRDVASGTEQVVVRDLPLCRCGLWPSSLAWSPGGRYLLYEAGAAGASTAWVFDTERGSVRSVGLLFPAARAWGARDVLIALDRDALLFDAAGGPPPTLAGPRGFARFDVSGVFVFASDGATTRVVRALDQHEVHRWDVAVGIDDALSFAGAEPIAALSTTLATRRLPPRHGCDGMLVLHPAPRGGEICVPGGANPAWSSDGGRLAYVTYAPDAATLHILDASSGRVTSIVAASSGCGSITLRWVGGGTHVAMSRAGGC